jgi:hypothetical protein
MTRLRLPRIFGTTSVGLSLVLWALVGATNCGGSEGSLVSPCESQLKCGAACSVADPCGSGQYCGSDKKSPAHCVPDDNRCGSGKRCDATSGKCIDSLVLTGGGSSNTGVGGEGTMCAGANVNLDKQIPTVLLLVDQSGSMNAMFGMSDRWQTLRTALMNTNDGIVNSLQDQVRFGLALYSGVANQPCPVITPVAPMMNNYNAIDAAYPVPTDAILDNTPTGESIDEAVKLLLGVQELGQKVIVLATDGDPDTCAEPNSNGQNPPREMAIEAAQNAFRTGIFTFVISVAADADQAHLAELANVGQGFPRNDPMMRSYLANNQAELASAFQTIVNGVRTCNFALDGMVKEGSENEGTVTLDGAVLPQDNPDGWHLSSPTTIELTGASCEKIKMGDHSLTASFTCGAVVPIEIPK